MRSLLKMVGTVVLGGLVCFSVASYSFSDQAVAGIKCKLVNKDTGKGAPAEFSARVQNSIDPTYVCIDSTGAGCSINVPDTGKQYEVRCFPWNAEYGLVDSTLPVYVSGHHAPVLDCRMKIASGNGDANFECKEWKEHHSLYEDAK
ncbi:MAG: hypothetical protein A2060_04040 [Planctomycetes bacterium GWA2_50_13]|jgi:hypothetical protein|nr:MAG: hypothetical protein A2060_04040 [Planctomycetes bacterium GWA2_50_13]OHB95883.1 MAG: hypothetical protein A3I59_01900 [Planctomycetes bacterium RIFCSPLOWO2_02_FULL_50_16]OHC03336.1 MAG: hypothetical protein A3G17_00055 [Planctomycetes bacterium RIFCSPLOWO2_12_FULL_50_35]HCN19243.1 hypothetical protein [Planctomycetia bacterium]